MCILKKSNWNVVLFNRQWKILLACEQALHFRKYREIIKIIFMVLTTRGRHVTLLQTKNNSRIIVRV